MGKVASLLLFALITAVTYAQDDTQMYFDIGRKEYERGNFVNAIQHFDRVLAQKRSEPAFLIRGYSKYYIHDYFGAIDDMDSVLAINPYNALALRCRGGAKRILKSYPDALEDLNKSISITPNDTSFVQRGLVKLDMKDSIGAMADFNALVKLEPTKAHYLQRGRLRTYLKDYKGAFADYDSARALNADSSDYSIEMGRAFTYEAMKDYGTAIGTYSQLLIRFPGKAQILVARGNAEAGIDIDNLAIMDYRSAIKSEPHNPAGYIAIAALRYAEAAYLMCITDYTKAIKVDPQNAELYFFRGKAKQILEKQAPAVKDFTEAIKLNPGYAIAYRYRGDAEKQLNRVKEAAADYFKATQLGSAKE